MMYTVCSKTVITASTDKQAGSGFKVNSSTSSRYFIVIRRNSLLYVIPIACKYKHALRTLYVMIKYVVQDKVLEMCCYILDTI